MRAEFLPFHRHDISQAEIDSVVETLKSPWITSGPKVREFEQNFAEYVGAKHALAVTSCTAALHLALEALGIKEGDEVLVPTMTFTATAEAVMYLRAKPVLVDVRRDTLNIDLKDAEKKINVRTKAIMPVHVAGLPADLEGVHHLARLNGLKVIEDAAHAFPTKYRAKFIGSVSDATCFSFYATKTMTTGEGGMLTTNSDAVAERVRMMRQHGLNRDVWKRRDDVDSWYYEVLESGFKYNMPDINAALGVAQLKRAEEFRAKRENISRFYREAFSDIECLSLPSDVEPDGLHSWHLFTLKLDPQKAGMSRSQLTRSLKERNIGTSVHWIPLHLHPFYQRHFGVKPEDFDGGTWLSERIFSLPIYPGMTETDIKDVVGAVRQILT